MNDPIYIFAGGGSGGHLYPGLAVADALRTLEPSARIVFACSDRSIDRRILDASPYGVVVQPVRPVPAKPAKLPAFLKAWRASRRLAAEMIRDLRPSAVLGLGGFAAGPIARSAAGRVRAGLLNPDAVPGKANRYLARYVDAIFTQFAGARESFQPRERLKVRCVGCPVRPSLANGDRDEAIRTFSLDVDKKTLLVLGGSQGAQSINLALDALAGEMDALADKWQILHVTGTRRERSRRPAKIHTVRLDYCDRMDLAYAAADLALSRGGAATIAELIATRTPAVVMPYPHHTDRQQRLNAAGLVETGAAVLVDDSTDPSENADRLRGDLLGIMLSAERLDSMRSAMGKFRHANATTTVAKWLLGTE